MTVAIPFDTHRFVKNLVQNGFSVQQAEVLAKEQVTPLSEDLATKVDIEALREGTKSDIEALRQATKKDIEALRQATKKDIKTLREATRADINEAKWSLVRWMFGAVFGLAGLIVALR